MKVRPPVAPPRSLLNDSIAEMRPYITDLVARGFQAAEIMGPAATGGRSIDVGGLLIHATKLPCENLDSCIQIKPSDPVCGILLLLSHI